MIKQAETVLPDPRAYPQAGKVNNPLLTMADTYLQASQLEEQMALKQQLKGMLQEKLVQRSVLAISVALAMATSARHYRVIWEALCEIVENPPKPVAMLVAMPLILVAGSRSLVTLPAQLQDLTSITALLVQHGVLASADSVTFSEQLVAQESLLEWDSLALYEEAQNAPVAQTKLATLRGVSVPVHGEGVFLRYMCGIAHYPQSKRFSDQVGGWGLDVMQVLHQQLRQEGVTLFVMPRAPQPLMRAMAEGRRTRMEVALQVFVSHQIRQIREQGKEPVALLSAHRNQELHITVTAQPSAEAYFVWPLLPEEDLGQIESYFKRLMAECKVSQVHVMSTLYSETQQLGVSDSAGL